MNVKQLRELLEGKPDDMPVLIPVSQEFDGAFYSPCHEDSGDAQLGDEPLSEEDLKEMELLNKPIPEEPAFLLVPCGFFEEQDHSHELN
jgi:hypothetical protein